MALAKMLPSFGAGELSPSLYARVDFDKYHVGAALLRNFFVDFRGGASTRPGTQFMGQAKSNGTVRLIPFIVSTSQAYICEFGHQYVRFFSADGQVVEAAKNITAITQANPCKVTSAGHGYTTGDEVVLSSIGGMTELNGRNVLVTVVDANNFTLKTLDGVAIDSTTFGAYTAGGTAQRVYTLASPYDAADIGLIKLVQSASVLTLTHPNYAPRNLTQLTANSFAFSNVVAGPTQDPPTNLTVSANGMADHLYGYAVTAVSLDGKEESLPIIITTLQGKAPTDATKVLKLRWSPPTKPASYYKIYKWGPVPNVAPVGTVYGYIGETIACSFTDSGIEPDFSQVPPQFNDPFSPAQISSITVTAAGTFPVGTYSVDLTITDATGTGATAFGIIDPGTNGLAGVVITNPGKNYTAPVITAPGATAAPTFVSTVTPSTGTYPMVPAYFQQRRCFGGFAAFPERLVLSQTGNYGNFNDSVIVQDTDGLDISMASQQVNAIKALVPMSTGLVVLTTGGAFQVSAGGQASAITPKTITAQAQASAGANDLPPILVNSNILYAQNRGTIIRELQFNYYAQSFTGNDRSQLANHLLFGKDITGWTWAEEPFKLIWSVRSDGKLLCMTYVPEQEVYAWTQHDTQGLFRSVASIPEGKANAVYFVVKRKIGGVWKNFIERMSTRYWPRVEDAWCVDCGLSTTQSKPDTTLYPSAGTGAGVTFLTDTAAFSAGDVGKIIWCGGGNATITGYTSPTSVTADFNTAMTEFLSDGSPMPQAGGAWSVTAPVLTLKGLWHLAGAAVSVLADGQALTNQAVAADGSLTLPFAASKVVVGLPFQCQLQTLYIDLGDPTQQGKRKTIPAVTLRLSAARGLKAGSTFGKLNEVRETQIPVVVPSPLFTGDSRIIVESNWTTAGQVCVQQDYPLPATVLGLIPEVVVGDTAR